MPIGTTAALAESRPIVLAELQEESIPAQDLAAPSPAAATSPGAAASPAADDNPRHKFGFRPVGRGACGKGCARCANVAGF